MIKNFYLHIKLKSLNIAGIPEHQNSQHQTN